eukprot:6212554-Pleurochrysis_carterae.AAC.3
MAALCPIFILSFLLICNPPASLGVDPNGGDAFALCANVPAVGDGCPALRSCVAAGVNASLLPPPFGLSGGIATAEKTAGAGLSVYFGTLYFTQLLTGWTGTQIPYDALGFELTSDYHEKSLLFGYKTAFQFGGYIVQIAISTALASAHGNDVLRRVRVESFVYAATAAATLLLLLVVVKERVVVVDKEKKRRHSEREIEREIGREIDGEIGREMEGEIGMEIGEQAEREGDGHEKTKVESARVRGSQACKRGSRHTKPTIPTSRLGFLSAIGAAGALIPRCN